MNSNLWQLKLLARIHDPAEKALVLYRDPSGHEGGSIVSVGRALGVSTQRIERTYRNGSTMEYEKLHLDPAIESIITKADHWAASADRPQFPKDNEERYPDWARVRFAVEGVLIHPLTGSHYDIGTIDEQILAGHIRTVSEDLFNTLIHRDSSDPDNSGNTDYYRTFLAFWRFGPELGRELEGIGHLWSLLPADTRIPDHTIWQHLDLTSALAGVMLDDAPALLTVSIGPVQDFISAGRSVSDLWAGSHFLSMMSWQAMKVIAEELGPDAIIFPQLRGVPLVDLWLIEKGVRLDLFEKYRTEWMDRDTDYNPLFGASLPNKFVAIVPENRGRSLAEKITDTVRKWVKCEAKMMLDIVLKEIGETPGNQPCYQQIEEQLKDFPEVHWALSPWPSESEIKSASGIFYSDGKGHHFFREIFPVLKEPIEPEAGWRFWEPNDGILYPVVHDCAERLLASAKSVRAFSQLEQRGYRDSLTGEYEWLTMDKEKLTLSPGKRKERDTIWVKLAGRRPSWCKEGEHLSTFGLINRLWPKRFLDLVKESRWYRSLDEEDQPRLNRYVVSTHVMALAPSLERLMKCGPVDKDAFRSLSARVQVEDYERPALPRKLMRCEYRSNQERWDVATKFPALIDDLREKAKNESEEEQVEEILKTVEDAIGMESERYYAILLMDGDRLGEWLSGKYTLQFQQSFHKKVISGLRSYEDERLNRYLSLSRPSSPARHMAISSALNGFSLDLVRFVVEDVCLGKLIYSGGDDVMAMVSVCDLPVAMWLLRLIYSGGIEGLKQDKEKESRQITERIEKILQEHHIEINQGFVKWRNHLYRVMGEKATASIGAVVAHHMTPLSAVLRHVREAERDSKHKGGRNAFSIRILKRAGGRQDITLPWWIKYDNRMIFTMEVIETLREMIFSDLLSRTVAYQLDEWVKKFPLIDDEDELITLLSRNIFYYFKRKTERSNEKELEKLKETARDIATVAVKEGNRRENSDPSQHLAGRVYRVLEEILFAAEFLARESRGYSPESLSLEEETHA